MLESMPTQIKLDLRNGWSLISSIMIPDAPEEVSSPNYDVSRWHPTTVPSTVLNALVKNGLYPDPRIGLNNFLIPDASDEYNKANDLSKYSYLPDRRNPWKDPYWYRTEFRLDPVKPDSKVWLVFNAINYRAEVWLNGVMIADKMDMVGAFSRFRYDITTVVKEGEANCLAVKIFGPDHTGRATTQLKIFERCRQPDGESGRDIFKDVTLNGFATGYDCVPEVRDRLMGILQDVCIETTGSVSIRDPFIKTKLPLPRTDEAALTVSMDLVNATSSPRKGVCRVEIEGEVLCETTVELHSQETRNICFEPERYPALVLRNPRLWWPVGYGTPDMYSATLSFECEGGVSDVETVSFGVREVEKVIHELDGDHGLQVHINGQRVFCRGGFLVLPDTLMDSEVLNRKRYIAELEYLVNANLNTVSLEEPANMPDEFFDLCDHYGLMFWFCFYQCHWMTRNDYPEDHRLLERCGIDLVKRYRNHPSIIVQMCMNEGQTAQGQYLTWRRTVADLDGTRILIPSGYGTQSDHRQWADWIKSDTPVGANDSMPKSYTWQPHSWYFRMVREHRSWMFKMEMGSAALPTLESIKRIIPDWARPLPDAPFPLNSTWAYHGANDYYKNYDMAIRRRFGEPASLEDYCWMAHVVTADQHRAMFEAVNHRKWDVTSGFIEWKLNSAWPDVQWQIYDYYLRPTPALYYIKKACEPLHIQLNQIDSMVSAINNRLTPYRGLKACVEAYDLDAKLKWRRDATFDMAADTYKELFQIPDMQIGPVYFVRMELLDSDARVLSDNFYWLSSSKEEIGMDALGVFSSPPSFDQFAEHHDINDDGAFLALKSLPQVKLVCSKTIERIAGFLMFNVKVANPSQSLAFFIHVMAIDPDTSEEILPVYWDDNYFSLLPGEMRMLSARLPENAATDAKLQVDGWNIVHDVVSAPSEPPFFDDEQRCLHCRT